MKKSSEVHAVKALQTLLLSVLMSINCAQCGGSSASSTREIISYYDRNGDGKVDHERHQKPDLDHGDLLLFDDNYDGRYEKRALYGVGVIESAVDLPVPTGVKIEAKKE